MSVFFRTMLNLSDPGGYLELWEAAAHRRKTGYDGTFTSVCNRLHIYAPEVANQNLFQILQRRVAKV